MIDSSIDIIDWILWKMGYLLKLLKSKVKIINKTINKGRIKRKNLIRNSFSKITYENMVLVQGLDMKVEWFWYVFISELMNKIEN